MRVHWCSVEDVLLRAFAIVLLHAILAQVLARALLGTTLSRGMHFVLAVTALLTFSVRRMLMPPGARRRGGAP